MTELVPSFILKMSRAEKHLIDLETAITAYIDSHPYTVRRRREGKNQREVDRLHFTDSPDPMLGLIAADFIYNVRSGLDHLAAALVPSKDRDSVMFPVFFQGVWNPSPKGENAQRVKDRKRWETVTRHMKPGAIAFLKSIQPADINWETSEAVNELVSLKRLSNTDGHSQLLIVSNTLTNVDASWDMPDGYRYHGLHSGNTGGIADDTKLPIPPNASTVQIEGTPLVLISYGRPSKYLRVPEMFTLILASARSTVEALVPYVWIAGGHSGRPSRPRQRRDDYKG